MTTRTLKAAVLALGFAMLAVSCGEKPIDEPVIPGPGPEPEPDPIIKLRDTEMAYARMAALGKTTYTIENPIEGEELKAESNAEWLAVTEITATEIFFSLEKNLVQEERRAIITVSYTKAESKTITIIQEEGLPLPVIVPSVEEVNIGPIADEGAFSVEVVNSCEKTLTVSCDADWFTPASEFYNASWWIDYQYETNPSEDTPRSCTLTLNYEDAEPVTVTVTQEPNVPQPVINLSLNSYPVDGKGGEFTVYFSISHEVAGVTASARSNWSWVQIKSVTNESVTFTVDENTGNYTRQACITLNYGTAEPKEFVVNQALPVRTPVIKVDTTTPEFTSIYQKITLECSVDNPVTNKYTSASYGTLPEWAEFNSSGYNEIAFIIQANNTGADRSFELTWKYEGAEDVLVTVTQKKFGNVDVWLGTDNIMLNKLGSQVPVPYSITNSPYDFTGIGIDEKPDWLYYLSYSENDHILYFQSEENYTGAVRSANMTLEFYFKGGNCIEKPVTISQNYKDLTLTISPTSATTDYKAGTVTINYTREDNSGSVTASSSEKWVKYAGSTNSTVTLKFEKNNSRNDRTATITIALTNHTSATFTLTQKGNPDFPANVVDLGLPNGLLWATENIGASSPTQVGNYYAWGETAVKSSYLWNNYAFGTENALTKYTGDSNRLSDEDDVAAKTLGKGWRMPTSSDMFDIDLYCTVSFITQNGVNGMKIYGNGKSIFIPDNGYKNGSSTNGTSDGCCYIWCKDRPEGSVNANNAWGYTGEGYTAFPRYYGLPVRAVFDPSKFE